MRLSRLNHQALHKKKKEIKQSNSTQPTMYNNSAQPIRNLGMQVGKRYENYINIIGSRKYD